MLLGFVLLNFLVAAGNLSPITCFDHPSNTKMNGCMDTSESTGLVKEKQTENICTTSRKIIRFNLEK